MKKNNKGFTLVELLAVIVILGLLMAIAIPSVTKYITQSRVKTLVSSIDSYITAVVTQVNDGEYKFSDSSKVFAIPIECVALEKGGTNPFGNWLQANGSYWAYVLVHYDSDNYNYEYGFTFKDDAGYGLYPTKSDSIENNMVRTGYDDLTQPKNGLITSFVTMEKWKGFSSLSSAMELVVLEAGSEGEDGDGYNTCTLCQKGDNYDQVEATKASRLINRIKSDNTVIPDNPTLTTSSNLSSDQSGLYASNDTNSGKATYYFRGAVDNNYVKFAGLIWRILRINEDGTIRLIMQDGINSNAYYRASGSSFYYTNTQLKSKLETWYNNNLKTYEEYIATSTYCEAARVKTGNGWNGISATMVLNTQYNPDFKCFTDGNGKGVVTAKVGLITYDELIYAGGYYYKDNDSGFLRNGKYFWTMSPYGTGSSGTALWGLNPNGLVNGYYLAFESSLRPVISLNSNIIVEGVGTSSSPYVVQTN